MKLFGYEFIVRKIEKPTSADWFADYCKELSANLHAGKTVPLAKGITFEWLPDDKQDRQASE